MVAVVSQLIERAGVLGEGNACEGRPTSFRLGQRRIGMAIARNFRAIFATSFPTERKTLSRQLPHIFFFFRRAMACQRSAAALFFTICE